MQDKWWEAKNAFPQLVRYLATNQWEVAYAIDKELFLLDVNGNIIEQVGYVYLPTFEDMKMVTRNGVENYDHD